MMSAMSETNKTIARRIAEEMLPGRPELAPELFSPEQAEKHVMLTKALMAGFPDLEMKVEDLIAEGDKVACRWSARGTHRGPFLGIGPTNVQASWTGISIHQIENGKVVESKTNWDSFELVQKLHAGAKDSAKF